MLSWWFHAEINYHWRIVPLKQFKPRASCLGITYKCCLKFTLSISHPLPPPPPLSSLVLRLYIIWRGALQAFCVPSCTHPIKQDRSRVYLHSKHTSSFMATEHTQGYERHTLTVSGPSLKVEGNLKVTEKLAEWSFFEAIFHNVLTCQALFAFFSDKCRQKRWLTPLHGVDTKEGKKIQGVKIF